jgi:hypothetical protein
LPRLSRGTSYSSPLSQDNNSGARESISLLFHSKHRKAGAAHQVLESGVRAHQVEHGHPDVGHVAVALLVGFLEGIRNVPALPLFVLEGIHRVG